MIKNGALKKVFSEALLFLRERPGNSATICSNLSAPLSSQNREHRNSNEYQRSAVKWILTGALAPAKSIVIGPRSVYLTEMLLRQRLDGGIPQSLPVEDPFTDLFVA